MQYHVQDPQGRDRIIEGPDGASDEDIISQAKNLFGHSGAMEPVQADPITAFRQHVAAHASNTSPLDTSQTDLSKRYGADPFQADINYLNDPKANVVTNAPGVLVDNLQAALGGITAPIGVANVASWGAGKIGGLMDLLKAPKAAEALAPAEDALSAGLTAKAGRGSELAQATNTKNALYNANPKEVKAPLPLLNTETENILNEIKNLPDSIQGKVKTLVSDYQEFGKKGAALGDIGVVRSHLGDIATNGEGVEKMYAARLGKALSQDVENFSNSSVLQNAVSPSQDKTAFAQDLRRMWGNVTNETRQPLSIEDIQQKGAYINPDVTQPVMKLDNTDIGANIKKANSYFKDFSALQQHPITQALDRAKPAQMSNVIFKAGNIDDVNVAKAVLGKTYNNMAGQFYEQLANNPKLSSQLSKMNPEFLNAALGSQRVQALQKLAQFNDLVAKAKLGLKMTLGGTAVGTALGAGYKLTH